MEDACHELDARGLLQGGSAAYQDYVTSFWREVELADKCDKLKDQIAILGQLVTFFTLTISSSATSSNLAQLQKAALDKKKELQEMVIGKCSGTMAYLHTY